MQIQHLAATLRRERIDVEYDRLFHLTMIAGPATRQTAVPRVSTIVSPPQYDVGRKDNRWRWIKRRRLARAYRESAALLTVAAGTADNAARYYHIPRDRFRVVPGPIDLLRVDAQSRRREGLEDFNPDRSHLLAVGRLSHEKGHATLIDAVARYLHERTDERLPMIDLHIAGDGPLKHQLTAQAVQLGIQDHVHLHGHVNNPYSLMRRCDLLCMPSLYEGMPNAMLEAMVCEVPVVASNTEQGPGELLRQHPIGRLVPVGDVAAWCKAIQDRFRNAPEWHARAVQANAYVRQHHDLDRWLETMSQIFLTVGGTPSR
jgi:glycosyltransferase involved in cell wall biosynthesis